MRKTLLLFGKYFVFLLLFYVLHRANISGFHFFAFGMLFALTWVGNHPLILAPLYLLSSVLPIFDLMYFWIDLVCVIIWISVYYLHKFIKHPLNWGLLGIYALLSNAGRFYFSFTQADMRFTLFVEVVLGVVTMFAYICYFECVVTKGIRKIYLVDELLSLGAVVFSLGVGVQCLSLGEYFYSFLLAFGCLFVSKVFSPMCGIVWGIMFGLGGAFGIENFLLFAVSVAVASVGALCSSNMRILSAFCEILTFVIVSIYFSLYTTIFEYLSFAIGALGFVLLPKSWLKFCSCCIIDEDKSIILPSIVNETRRELSAKLVNLSDMFLDMKNIYFSYGAGGKLDENIDLLVLIVRKRLCADCPNRNNCVNLNAGNVQSIVDMLRLAYERGKLFIIDAPPNMCAGCNNLTVMINTVNQVINEFKSKEQKHKENSREKLLLSQSMGEVSELIKQFGLNLETKLVVEPSIEKGIIEALSYEKISCIEVKALKRDNQLFSLVLLLKKQSLDKNKVSSCISKLLKIDFFVLKEFDSDIAGFCSVVLEKSPRYELLYGCSGTTKSGSESSGDTHSVLTIDSSRVLLSICDGMGTGKNATDISKITLGLVESFFKAGYNTQVVLPIINRLLVLGDREIFSALDVGVLDLYSGCFDLLKFGSATTYLKQGDNLVRIEGAAMPLGILEEVSPKLNSYILKNDDYIMLFSDGVVDSFSHIEELENMLKNSSNLNPQTLANAIIKQALQKNNFLAKDDMTALIVRIIKKIN